MSEAINFRSPNAILKDVDKLIKVERYKNRTDFILTAMRGQLKEDKGYIEEDT